MKSTLFKILIPAFVALCFTVSGTSANTAVVTCGGGEENKKCPYGPKIVSKTERYGARCCAKKQFYPLSKKQPGCRVYGGTITDIPGPGLEEGGEEGLYCPWSLTYEEADLHCTNLKARICTKEEIDFRCAKSTGCHLNWEYVWTYTPVTKKLSQQDCLSLPDASTFNLGGFAVSDDGLPHGCQYYFDPSAPSYNRVVYNVANEDETPFANLKDTANAYCTSCPCLRSYSVMQAWESPDGSTLSQADCAMMPKASESNAGGFVGSWDELPYGCQMLLNPAVGEDDRVVFNTANENGVPNCTSGWCLMSVSVMQVWIAPAM